MITVYKKALKDKTLITTKKLTKGTWIAVVDPSAKELDFLVEKFQLYKPNLEDGLDENELPRIELDEGSLYIIFRKAIKEGLQITTLPILTVVTPGNIITLSKTQPSILSDLQNAKVHFNTTQKTQFLLRIFQQVFTGYDRNISTIEKELRKNRFAVNKLRNEDIQKLVNYEETLHELLSMMTKQVNILQRVLTGKYIQIYEKDRDIIEDLMTDGAQTLEMCRTQLRTITSVREAYQAILTNNLNKVIRFFTAITIVLTIPTIIASIFGMNVKLPFANSPSGFLIIMGITLVISAILVVVFIYEKWL